MTTAMSTSISHHDRRHNRPAGTGFTLIELLAVIVILGIIVALVISVGAYLRNEGSRKSTVATMDIIANAVAAFQEENGKPPLEAVPTSPTGTDEAQAKIRCQNLYTWLQGVKRSADLLAALPEDAIDKTASPWCFLDGYGNAIDYKMNGGVGNKPVLISAGPDGKFSTTGDNIRSDGRK